MNQNLFFYLSAGFNIGAISSIVLRLAKSNFLSSKKEAATLVLSGLAAASSVGFLLANKESEEDMEENNFIDSHEDTTKKLETLLI